MIAIIGWIIFGLIAGLIAKATVTVISEKRNIPRVVAIIVGACRKFDSTATTQVIGLVRSGRSLGNA